MDAAPLTEEAEMLGQTMNEGGPMSRVENRAEPRTEGLEAHEIYPEAAFVGLRPIELRRDDTESVLRRVRRVRGITSVRVASADDDPTGGWDDGDTVGQTRLGGDIEVFALIATLGLVAFFWDLYGAYVIDLPQLDGMTPLPDRDLIKLENKPGTPGFLQITLRAAPNVTWWKDIELRDSKTVTRATAWTQDQQKENTLVVSNDALRSSDLLIGKAKEFGIHAMKYQMFGLQRFPDRHLILNWNRD